MDYVWTQLKLTTDCAGCWPESGEYSLPPQVEALDGPVPPGEAGHDDQRGVRQPHAPPRHPQPEAGQVGRPHSLRTGAEAGPFSFRHQPEQVRTDCYYCILQCYILTCNNLYNCINVSILSPSITLCESNSYKWDKLKTIYIKSLLWFSKLSLLFLFIYFYLSLFISRFY